MLYSNYMDVWVLFEVYRNNNYEKVIMIEKGDIVVDIGAHVGMFTVKALKESGKEGFVVAIEPEPINVEILRKNTRKYDNVAIVKKAVGEKKCRAKLYLFGKNLSSCEYLVKNMGREESSGVMEVEMDRLDNILSGLGISEVDFVKMDVEGAELEVLKGAGEYLKKIKKIAIAAEHYPGEHEEVGKFLMSKGFSIKKMQIKGKWHVYGWTNNEDITNSVHE